MRWLVLLLGLLGCDDPPSGGDRDRPLSDAMADGSDAATPRDAEVDTDPRDLGIAQDMATLDAAADMGPHVCVGVVLPAPLDSSDGSEVCNYRDDDGDGLIDEGFPYEFLGEPLRISEEPAELLEELHIAWSGDGYGVVWYARGGLHFVKLDARGCPLTPVQVITQNPSAVLLPGSIDLAFSGNRFAAVFTQGRNERAGIGTFVQIFALDGAPMGNPIDLDPTLSHFAFNVIMPYEEQFAVFSAAIHPQTGGRTYSAFAILDQEGRFVSGPSHPYNAAPGSGMGILNLIGVAYDGEGFGMAWHAAGNPFMRWAPDGQVLVPPVETGWLGSRAFFSGIAWTGEHYVIPNDGYDGKRLHLDFLNRSGEHVSRAMLGMDAIGTGTVEIHASEGGLYHFGAYSGVYLTRLDRSGHPIAPSLPILRRRVEAFTPNPGGALASVNIGVVEPGARENLGVFFSRIGCEME